VNNYFSRQVMLWGEDIQNSLSSKSILIVGSGGLGCSVALALSGSGVGVIDIVDFDKVEIHNIHRQVLFSIEDCGEYKAKVASNKIKSRNPYLKSDYFCTSFQEFSKQDKEYSLIIDATDNLEVRADIDNYAKKKNIAWVYGSVEEFNAQVCLFKDASFDIFAINKVAAKGIAAPMVMQAASLEANLALRYLASKEVSSDLLYYLYYNNSGEFEVKKFNLKG